MKTILVFLALLLGTVLNISTGKENVATKDTINGWYFLKANKDVDTAYTRLTSKSYQGGSAQIFGNSTKNNKDTSKYRKDLNKSYLFPKFVFAKAALDSTGKDSSGGAGITFFVGNKKNPNIIYKMSAAGANGMFLQHPEWFPRPYWLDAGSKIFGPFVKPDSVDFVVMEIIYSWDNGDPKCEFIVDNLKFAYGKGNPWEDPAFDSTIMIDRFGDSGPSPVFGIDKKVLDFGAVKPGSTKTDTVSITNIHRDNVAVTKIWSDNPDFSVEFLVGGFTLEPNRSADIVINFLQDTVRLVKTGLLMIKNAEEPDYIDTINLVAHPEPVAKLSFTPKSMNFGVLKINEVSHKDTLVIFRNTGNDTVKGNISVTGKGFLISNRNLLIAPMDSMIKVVRFAPAETGKVSEYLIITSNSPSSPDTVYLTGTVEKTTGIQENPETPKDFSLSQNYPNPFNPSTTIEFSLPKTGLVDLTIYNMLGQEVKTLVNGELNEGVHKVSWNAEVPSGTYFYRLNAGNFVETKKMILMK